MRDIALTLVFVAVMGYALRRHFALPLVWVWLSLMNPHRLAFGFAYSFPFAQISAITALLVLPFSKSRHGIPFSVRPVQWLAVFYIWMCISSLASFNDSAEVFEMWVKVTKVQLMVWVGMMLLRGRQQIDMLVWTMALSIGFYGIKGGIFTILKGGTSMVMGPAGTFIEGTNDIAMAMTMVVPLFYYLATTLERKSLRILIYVGMGLTTLSVLGTTSRGALLAVCATAAFLGFKSGRPVVTTLISLVGLALLTTLMSDHWADKMGSIATYQDHSAQSRIYTWQMIWNMVQHHPWTGGGFLVTENPLTWQAYAVTEYLKAYSPHSIYFQALAEHGFPGLLIYLALGFSTYRLSNRVIIRARRQDLEWAASLMGMVQASLIAFAVGGAFVNLVNFDLPYYLLVVVVLTDQAVKSEQKSGEVASATSQAT